MRCAARDRRRLLNKSDWNGPPPPPKCPGARCLKCVRPLQLVRVDIALRIEDDMLSTFLLALFLLQFLVIVGEILFAILFSRPEVPVKGHGGLERVVVDDDDSALQQRQAEPAARKNGASGHSHTRMNRVWAVRPLVFTRRSFPSGGVLYQNAARKPSWFENN